MGPLRIVVGLGVRRSADITATLEGAITVNIRRLAASAAVPIVLSVLLGACGAPQVPDDRNGGAEPPAAPSNLTVTAGYGYNIIAWTDNSDNETGFRLYRSAVTTSQVAPAGVLAPAQQPGDLLAELPADTESYVDDSLVPGQSYVYSVVATGAGGASAPSSLPESVESLTGFTAQVGVGSAPGSQGTSVLFHLALPASASSEPLQVEVTGPAGWGDGQPLVLSLTPEEVEGRWAIRDLWAVEYQPGDYGFALGAEGATYTAVANLPSEPSSVPALEAVRPTAASGTAVAGEWSPHADLLSYVVVLRSADGSDAVVGEVGANGPSATLEALSLSAGDYYLEVTGYTVDVLGLPLPDGSFAASMGRSEPLQVLDSGEACLSATPIVDAVLALEVSWALGLGGAAPTCADLPELTTVDILIQEDGPVTTLEGLQYAPNLQAIAIFSSTFEDLEPLAGLPLRTLRLVSSGVSDISALSSVPTLERLIPYWGAIEDFSPLADLTALTTLTLEMETVDDTVLPHVVGHALTRLELIRGSITTLAPLAGMTTLDWLDVNGNELSAVEDLELLVELFSARRAAVPEGLLGLVIHGNDFDLDDPDVQATFAQLRDIGVQLEETPQR